MSDHVKSGETQAPPVPQTPEQEPPLLHETKALNPWHPETDKLRLAVLGKLAEELGEASAIVARCIIQGIDACEPVTKKPNKVALENELADVDATVRMATDLFKLDAIQMREREERKVEHLTRWHELIGAALTDAGSPSLRDGDALRAIVDDLTAIAVGLRKNRRNPYRSVRAQAYEDCVRRLTALMAGRTEP